MGTPKADTTENKLMVVQWIAVLAAALFVLDLVANIVDAAWVKVVLVGVATIAAYRVWRRMRRGFGPSGRIGSLPVAVVVTGLIALVLAFTWLKWTWLILFALVLLLLGATEIERRIRQKVVSSKVGLWILAGLVVSVAVAQFSDGNVAVGANLVAFSCAYLAITYGTKPWHAELDRRADVEGRGAWGWAGRKRRRGVGWLGLAAMAVCWWVGKNAGLWALAIVAVVWLLSWVTASNNDSILVLAVVAIMIGWAVLPRSDDVTSVPDELGVAASAHPVMVAMGDSYMSGEGAPRYERGTNVRSDNTCRRALTTHAERLEERSDPRLPEGLVTVSLACSGAEILDVEGAGGLAVDDEGEPRHPGEPIDWTEVPAGADQVTQLAQILTQAGPERITGVMLSVGGNDAGFARIGKACIGAGDCSELSDIFVGGLTPLREQLVDHYRSVRSTMDAAGGSEVPLVAVGYPESVLADGCWWTLLQDNEHRFISGFISMLNMTVASAADEAGIEFLAGLPGSFAPTDDRGGLRICEDGFWSGGVNFVALNPMEGDLAALIDPRNWINNSFHPNPEGHAAMLEVTARWWGDRLENGPSPIAAAGYHPPSVSHPCLEARAAAAAAGENDPCKIVVNDWSRNELAAGLRDISIIVTLTFAFAWFSVTPPRRQRRS